MSWQRFNLCGAALLVLIGYGITATAQTAAPPPAASADASDIVLGKPPKYPSPITPVVEGGQLLDTHHGEPLTAQELLFNPTTHELSLGTNPKQRIYADAQIDSAYYNTDLTLFDYLTTDRAPIGKIILLSAKKKVVVSPNYVVSPKPNKPVPIDPSTYQASVQFVKGDESNKPGTTLTVRRNAEAPAPLADMTFSKISRKNDVITWTVERGGAVVKTGSFGFPIVATETDLVRYVIQLP